VAPLRTGDRVRVHLDQRLGIPDGWYSGVIVRIEPYSEHRSFYWVELDGSANLPGLHQISVLNPKNIQPLSSSPMDPS
jgi:protein involved in polysaccharide export with SLBB domain